MSPPITTDFHFWKSLACFPYWNIAEGKTKRHGGKQRVPEPSRVHSKSPLCLTTYKMLWTQFPVSLLKTGSATVCIGSGRDSARYWCFRLSSCIIIWERGAGILSWLSWPEENGKSLGTSIKQVHTSALPLVYSSFANTNGVLPTFPSKSWTENFN